MAMNKYMHPRNPYKKPPDFLQLTLDYPNLRKFVKPDLSGKIKMNFKKEGAVRELTTCLLHKDFGLKIELPPDRLVPTLPLRMNYLLWIEDLLNEPGKQLRGIDIGTGASCIYPLLAVKHFKWKMTGTEIDAKSVEYAVKNVDTNNLNDYIEVKAVKDNVMLEGALEENERFDFCMCNPPFFSDESETVGKARTDRRAPPRNCQSGRSFELVAPGGETAFVSRIIDDSARLGDRIKVYTVMIGHKVNLNKVKDSLKRVHPVKMRTTEFCQGRTTRWGVAWTFSLEDNLISTAIQPKKDGLKPPFRWVYPGTSDLQTLKNQTLEVLKTLSIDVEEITSDDNSCGLCLKAFQNTWSHSRRKRREEKRKHIEVQAVSPCDSVVTANDSLHSNKTSPPSSPIDSIGYNSSDETVDKIDPVTVTSADKDKSIESSKKFPAVKNVKLSQECCDTRNSDDVVSSSKCCDIENVNLNFSHDRIISSSLQHNVNCEDQPHSEATLETDIKLKACNSEETSNKRKLEQIYDSPQLKVRRMERPFLDGVLTLSEFDGDIIFSLSFVDGTGGRESANQVLQYLKNKFSCQTNL